MKQISNLLHKGVLVWDHFLDTEAVFPPELPCETESQEKLKCNKGKVVEISVVPVRKFSAWLQGTLQTSCGTAAPLAELATAGEEPKPTRFLA